MKVEIQFTPDCPNAQPMLQQVAQLAQQTPNLTLVATLVEPGRPVPAGFAGSPTVLVDGVNPFPGELAGQATCALHPPTVSEVLAVVQADHLAD
jgi:hypothetical protein